MILAILQGDDYETTIEDLNEHGFYVTVLHSSGGFLKRRNVTIMMALPESRIQEALDILKQYAGERDEEAYETPWTAGRGVFSTPPPVQTTVHRGGIIIFVMSIDQSLRY